MAFAAMDDGFTHDVELGTYPDELMKPDLLILLTVDERTVCYVYKDEANLKLRGIRTSNK